MRPFWRYGARREAAHKLDMLLASLRKQRLCWNTVIFNLAAIMSDNKTRPTDLSVENYLAGITPASRQTDCRALLQLMQQASGYPAVMWGDSMVGFGSYHYRYDSGRQGDMFLVGFSSRKAAISLYLLPACGAATQLQALLAQLGKYQQAVSCLSVKRLADIDTAVLSELIRQSISLTLQQYPAQ